jgi:hypothetical protein
MKSKIYFNSNLRSLDKLVIEYLKNITKVSRIKLILKLISKKDKEIINEIFDILESSSNSGDILTIKDNLLN